MSTKTFTLSKEAGAQGNRPKPIFSVWGWELRRIAARTLNWAFGLATFLFFMAMMWFKHAWTLGTETGLPFTLYGTSRVGLLYEFTVVLMLVFAFMLPFVVTEGVARDYKKRVHEVLMTTPLPTQAYVWGRFLAVLSIALGQAVLMLIAGLMMGTILHSRNSVYPQPGLTELLTAWGLIVIPAMILITCIGFSLGTLWPKRTRITMLGILIAWILFFTMGDLLKVYNPTGSGILGSLIPQLIHTANVNLASIPVDQRAAWVLQLQSTLPDLRGWAISQSALAIIGLLAVVVTAVSFRRFREALN